ncbi:MAG TPA: hypothetical protein VFB78_11480 [Acidimicrobiales bacterium]|nr:hypothetical protein [Acidimicrobiales bacterium]
MTSKEHEAAELLAIAETLGRHTRRRLHATSLIAGLAALTMLVPAALSGLGMSLLTQAVVSSVLATAAAAVIVRRWTRSSERFDAGPPAGFGPGVLTGSAVGAIVSVLVTQGRPPSVKASVASAVVLIASGLVLRIVRTRYRFLAPMYAGLGVLLLAETWAWPHSVTPRRTASGFVFLVVAFVAWRRTNRPVDA